MHVRVPASSANLGPGFDTLGMALGLYVDLDLGEGPPLANRHPALVAFESAGGKGPIRVRSQIPMGRGLGFSGAARVAGLLAALAQQAGPGVSRADLEPEVLARACALEGHADNVAASLYGGIVAVAGGRAVRVPVALDPAVVVWIPDAQTSTDESRARLAQTVPFSDAVFNVGRTALLVAALAAGDTSALILATDDRLHQDVRLAHAPESRAAMAAAVAAGAWCAWLSGSGPTIAALARRESAEAIAGILPPSGHSKVLSVDPAGAVLTI